MDPTRRAQQQKSAEQRLEGLKRGDLEELVWEVRPGFDRLVPFSMSFSHRFDTAYCILLLLLLLLLLLVLLVLLDSISGGDKLFLPPRSSSIAMVLLLL